MWLPRGTVPNRILVPCRCHPYPIPPIKVGHATRVYDPYSFQIVMCLFFKSHKNKSVKVLWDGTYGFSSLSEKTRKFNHLKMSLPRLHFLLSHLKTPSVSPARVWTATSWLANRHSPNWANQAAVKCKYKLWTFLRQTCMSFPFSPMPKSRYSSWSSATDTFTMEFT